MDFSSNYSLPSFEFDSENFINTLFQEDGFSAEIPLNDLIHQNSGYIDGRDADFFNDNSSISTPRTTELRSPVCIFCLSFLTL